MQSISQVLQKKELYCKKLLKHFKAGNQSRAAFRARAEKRKFVEKTGKKMAHLVKKKLASFCKKLTRDAAATHAPVRSSLRTG